MADGGYKNPLEQFQLPHTPEAPAKQPEASAEMPQKYLQKIRNPEFARAMAARTTGALAEISFEGSVAAPAAAVEAPKSVENKFANESAEDLKSLLADLENKMPTAKETMQKVYARRIAEIQGEITKRDGVEKPQLSSVQEVMPESALVQHLNETAPAEKMGDPEQDLARAREQLRAHTERMQADTTATAAASEKMKAQLQEDVARKQKEAETMNAAIDAQKVGDKKVEQPAEVSSKQLADAVDKLSTDLLAHYKYKALMPDNLQTLKKLIDGARDDMSRTKLMKSFVVEAEKVIAQKKASAAAETESDRFLASRGKFTEGTPANDNKEQPDIRKAA